MTRWWRRLTGYRRERGDALGGAHARELVSGHAWLVECELCDFSRLALSEGRAIKDTDRHARHHLAMGLT